GIGQESVSLNTGDALLSHPLDFDLSPGTTVGGSPSLVYNSGTVDVRPVVGFSLTGALPAVPVSVGVAFSWAGAAAVNQTFNFTGPTPVDGLRFGMRPVAAVTDSGVYGWSAVITVNWTPAGGSPQTQTLNLSGLAPVVVNESAAQTGGLGAGWGIGGIHRLVVPAGAGAVIYVTGSGEYRVFTGYNPL